MGVNSAGFIGGSGEGGSISVETINKEVSISSVKKIKVPNNTLRVEEDGESAVINNLPRGSVGYGQPGLSILNDKIVAAWTMNNAAEPVVESRNGYNLKVYDGTPTYEVSAKFGSGIRLGKANGCLSRSLNNYLGMKYGSKFSFSMWVSLSSSTSERGYLLNLYESSSNRTYFFTSSSEIKLVNISNSSALQAVISPQDLIDNYGVNLFDGEIHHIVGSWDTSDSTNLNQSLYIDNKQVLNVTSARASFSVNFLSGNITIAGENEISNSGFGGQVGVYDEIVIFKDRLTGSQISELWNGGQGVSLTSYIEESPGFNEALISDFNPFIRHVWLFNGAGTTVIDYQGLVSLQGENTYTRKVAGRWDGTFATRFTPAGSGRFVVENGFDGPDGSTEFVVSFQAKFHTLPSGGSNQYRFFELGNRDSNGGSQRETLALGQDGLLSSYDGHSPLISIDVSDFIGDDEFHTVTFGRRKNNIGEEEQFVAVDDGISYAVASWSDMSASTYDLGIGRSIIFQDYAHNQAPDADIQNMIIWQGEGCSMSNDAIFALSGAQIAFGGE